MAVEHQTRPPSLAPKHPDRVESPGADFHHFAVEPGSGEEVRHVAGYPALAAPARHQFRIDGLDAYQISQYAGQA